MFKTFVLAAYVAVSFAATFLGSAIPARADDDYDDLMDEELAAQGSSATNGAGAGKISFNEF